MSEVKRWGVESDEQDGQCSLYEVEVEDGKYVMFEDYAKLQKILSYTQNDEIDARCYIAELKAQRDALAVECAQYKSMAERFAERADDYKSGHFGYSVFDSSNEFKQHIKTPATDAYLNSVRAEGVEIAASDLFETTAIGHGMLMAFAAQLRAGKDGE